jgi:hypothetical protein
MQPTLRYRNGDPPKHVPITVNLWSDPADQSSGERGVELRTSHKGDHTEGANDAAHAIHASWRESPDGHQRSGAGCRTATPQAQPDAEFSRPGTVP